MPLRASSAPAARSCAPSRKLLNRQTATDSTPFRREGAGGRGDIGWVQWRSFLAVGGDAALHRQAQMARHQHLGEGRAMVPLVLAHAAADLERIAEALGGQHPDLGALLLEDGVGGDGRAVHEQRAGAQQLRQRQVELLGGEPQHAQHAFAGIGRHRRCLEDADGAGRVAQHHVGEGAADIDADAPRWCEGRRNGDHCGSELSPPPQVSSPACCVLEPTGRCRRTRAQGRSPRTSRAGHRGRRGFPSLPAARSRGPAGAPAR